MEHASTQLPRVTIQFCTQCKWMLRAAYFAQELLSTFGTALGEVALQPSTGGTFIVEIYHASAASSRTVQDDGGQESRVLRNVLWDRKVEGGFPETKELKRRVRDIIEPGRDLGHVDGKKKTVSTGTSSPSAAAATEVEAAGRSAPPKALGELQGQSSERKFTPMDVDGIGVTGEQGGEVTDVKRNGDGSICEDCN